MFKYLLWLMCTSLWATTHDPFVVPVKKHHGQLKEQRIQYLGYLKMDNKVFGFIRRVGGEIERIQKGRVTGLGHVTSISAHEICINKSQQKYCLSRTSQMNHWNKVEPK